MTYEQTPEMAIEDFVARCHEAREHADRAGGSLEVAAEDVHSSDQWKLQAIRRDLRKIDEEIKELARRAYSRLPGTVQERA